MVRVFSKSKANDFFKLKNISAKGKVNELQIEWKFVFTFYSDKVIK